MVFKGAYRGKTDRLRDRDRDCDRHRDTGTKRDTKTETKAEGTRQKAACFLLHRRFSATLF